MRAELWVKSGKSFYKCGTRRRLENDLPRMTGGGAFVETRQRRGDFKRREGVLNNKIMQRFGEELDFRESGFFCFIGYGDFGEIRKRRDELFLAFFD